MIFFKYQNILEAGYKVMLNAFDNAREKQNKNKQNLNSEFSSHKSSQYATQMSASRINVLFEKGNYSKYLSQSEGFYLNS